MATRTSDFWSGLIEGFYGPPWSAAERLALFDTLAAGGLNTYVYAPKDDVKHRALWREPYTAAEAVELRTLVDAAHTRGLRFVYALGPGLDLRYADAADLAILQRRFDQVLDAGADHLALLFDDIPDRMAPADEARYGSFASAQCHIANALLRHARARRPAVRLLFCPTAYCGRMAERRLGGEGYLAALGRELDPAIEVLWTGPEIISREITVAHVRGVVAVLGRRPVIWDNLHANDYDGRRFYCGPYAGRPPELRAEVGGLLVNPNCEYALNAVPLQTFAAFLRSDDAWDARAAYLAALRSWLARFETVHGPLAYEDLVLFGDAFYLPHEDGPEAAALLTAARAVVAGGSAADARDDFRGRAVRLRDFCARLAELKDRPLFYALSRRIWELREELDLLLHYAAARSDGTGSAVAFHSDFHLAQTYRGGLVARLQGLLRQDPDGGLGPAGDGGNAS